MDLKERELARQMSKKKYDVFLSYNSADKQAVDTIAHRLCDEAHLEPFLDKWHLVPGAPWQEALEAALDASCTCAVFLGPAGLGTWENEEMRSALDIRASQQDFRVIPVLLPGSLLSERGRLPSFLARHTWVDFRSGLDDAEAFHRLVCGIQGVAPSAERTHKAEAVCPFRGLQVFEEEHACFFFGREALTQHLVEQLRADRFLAVIGPSGSGKSSLVRAGLIPQVCDGALTDSQTWPIIVMKPGPHPLETLAARLSPLLPNSSDPLAVYQSLLSSLQQDQRGLHHAVQLVLAAAPDSQRLLFVIDQFEELFTLCRDEQVRSGFIENILYASLIAGGQTVVVVTMRADFLGKCAVYPELAARLSERDVLVGPLSQIELRRAMEEPAKLVGLYFEKGLVETLIADAGHEPGMLPLVQHTLLELWKKRRGDWLTIEAYHQIGGVQGALDQRANQVYASLNTSQQAAARRILLRLTQPGESTEDTRRRAPLPELLPASGKAADVEAVVRKLADARLLTTDQDEQGQEIVDVAHEALIRGWPLLRSWLDEDRAALRIRRRLTEVAAEWERNSRDESFLYRGKRLTEVLALAEADPDELSPLEWEFLRAGEKLRQVTRQAKRRARLWPTAVGGLTGGLLGGLMAIIVSFLADLPIPQEIVAVAIGTSLLGGLYGVIIALGLGLESLAGEWLTGYPIIGGAAAGMLLGILQGLIEGWSRAPLNIFIYAFYGSGIALSLALGNIFRRTKGILIRALAGSFFGMMTGIVTTYPTLNSAEILTNTLIGFGTVVGIGIVEDSFKKEHNLVTKFGGRTIENVVAGRQR